MKVSEMAAATTTTNSSNTTTTSVDGNLITGNTLDLTKYSALIAAVIGGVLTVALPYFGKDASGNPTSVAVGSAAAIAAVAIISIAIIVASDLRARAMVHAAAYQPKPLSSDRAKSQVDVLKALSTLHSTNVL